MTVLATASAQATDDEVRALLRRAHYARILLRSEPAINRSDLLAAVVWPSPEALRMFAVLESTHPWHERVPKITQDREPCAGLNIKGRPCSRPSAAGSPYCPSHADWGA